MRNKMFYRYSQNKLCSITSAGQKELHELLISYDFPMSFEGEFINFILHSDATTSEKLIRTKEKINEMNEARHSALLHMLDKERSARDERLAWKEAEEQRIEYNRQQREMEDQRKQHLLSGSACIVIIIAFVFIAYLILGEK